MKDIERRLSQLEAKSTNENEIVAIYRVIIEHDENGKLVERQRILRGKIATAKVLLPDNGRDSPQVEVLTPSPQSSVSGAAN
jgi:hypothetical protein